MMRNLLSDAAIAHLIEEDVPYFAVTTFGLCDRKRSCTVATISGVSISLSPVKLKSGVQLSSKYQFHMLMNHV